MTELEYVKAERISLKKNYTEKWLQDRIEEDPSILGLGDLTIVRRERQQSTGGRIDFLLYNPETETMYETEIMLGSTDESHIVRTIEYWDIERRRFPNKDHKAVLVAEDITNRFFNVISLMNRSIPIIAIQLNALKVDNKLLLNATTVLDIYESPEDDQDISETVDRNYWENRSHPQSMALMDEMITMIRAEHEAPRITYNKYHVAVGTAKKNFIWLRPRKRAGYCHFEIKVGRDNLEDVKTRFDDASISFNNRKEDILAVAIQTKELSDNKKRMQEILQIAVQEFA